VKWENGEKEERRKAERNSLAGQTLESLCCETIREEGGRCQLFCKLRELLIPIQR